MRNNQKRVHFIINDFEIKTTFITRYIRYYQVYTYSVYIYY